MECVRCVCFAWGGMGGEGGEWMRGLDLAFTNPVGTREVLDVCLGSSVVGMGLGPGSGGVVFCLSKL